MCSCTLLQEVFSFSVQLEKLLSCSVVQLCSWSSCAVVQLEQSCSCSVVQLEQLCSCAVGAVVKLCSWSSCEVVQLEQLCSCVRVVCSLGAVGAGEALPVPGIVAVGHPAGGDHLPDDEVTRQFSGR